MTTFANGSAARVGPVLTTGALAQAIVEALRRGNADLDVVDRGSYLRVTAPGRCVLDRRAVEECLGRPFALPSDLESVMPSFSGRLAFDGDTVTWLAPPAGGDR